MLPLSGDSTMTSFIEDDLEDLEEEDEDATQLEPDQDQNLQGQGQASNKQPQLLSRKMNDALVEWMMAYRKRFGSVKYRVLPETTIIAMAVAMPLTLEVERGVEREECLID